MPTRRRAAGFFTSSLLLFSNLLKDPVTLAAYAARIARFRATVSLALATAVASSLRYGIDHLSKGPVDPADAADGGVSDSDADASGSED